MDKKRRAVLSGLGTVVLGGLAGCTSSDDSEDIDPIAVVKEVEVESDVFTDVGGNVYSNPAWDVVFLQLESEERLEGAYNYTINYGGEFITAGVMDEGSVHHTLKFEYSYWHSGGYQLEITSPEGDKSNILFEFVAPE